MPKQTETTKLTKKQKNILTLLSGGFWRTEDELKSTFSFLQNMYFLGLIDGAGKRDDRGSGNYKHSRMWKITAKGKEAMQ